MSLRVIRKLCPSCLFALNDAMFRYEPLWRFVTLAFSAVFHTSARERICEQFPLWLLSWIFVVKLISTWIFFRSLTFDASIVLCKQIYSNVSCVAKKRVSRWCTTDMFRQLRAQCTIFPNWYHGIMKFLPYASMFLDLSDWRVEFEISQFSCVTFCFPLNRKWKQSPALRFQ